MKDLQKICHFLATEAVLLAFNKSKDLVGGLPNMIKQGVQWRRSPCCTTVSIFSASLKDAAPSRPCCKDLVQLSQKLSLELDCDCFVTAL